MKYKIFYIYLYYIILYFLNFTKYFIQILTALLFFSLRLKRKFLFLDKYTLNDKLSNKNNNSKNYKFK